MRVRVKVLTSQEQLGIEGLQNGEGLGQVLHEVVGGQLGHQLLESGEGQPPAGGGNTTPHRRGPAARYHI